MTWQVTWTQAAQRDLRSLDRTVAQRIVQRVDRLAETEQGNVRKLRGTEGEWRLRVGDWRVRFSYNAEERTILVLRVLHRSEAYR